MLSSFPNPIPVIELGKPIEGVKYATGGSVSTGTKGIDFYAHPQRMAAVMTYGEKAFLDINNVCAMDIYPIAVPEDATKITVTCPGFTHAFMLLKYENDAYTLITNPGWATLGGGSITFEAGTYSHVAINYKNSSNTNIPTDTDTSGFSIQFD